MKMKGNSNGRSHDLASLQLKAIGMCGDPKMLVDAMKSHPRGRAKNTNTWILHWGAGGGVELFGSTKQKVNLSGVDFHSHQPEK